ncbi:sphingomyelin phosphodiesterase [Bacillus manliponensis]
MIKQSWLRAVCSLGISATTLFGASSALAETTNHQEDALKVMTHNVYMLSTNLYPNWGQQKRADLIGEAQYIKNQDVVILNEVFDNSASTYLLNNLVDDYPHQTPVLGRSNGSEWDQTLGSYSKVAIEDGGVAVVSKWPIVEKMQYVFQTGCGPDAQSNKGFVYTKIKKGNEFIHVIGTHLQAEDNMCLSTSPEAVRALQMKEIQTFIHNKQIPANEYVLIGGDINVDKGNSSEYASMLSTLHAVEPNYTGHTATWDTATNSIAKYNYPTAQAEHLDYIVASKNHKQPIYMNNEVLPVKSPQWSVTAYFKTYTYDDYSDHYPVQAIIIEN